LKNSPDAASEPFRGRDALRLEAKPWSNLGIETLTDANLTTDPLFSTGCVIIGRTAGLPGDSELTEINRESGNHQDDGIGSASYGLIDAPQSVAIPPPQ